VVAFPLLILAFTVVGVVVARSQPRNPVGWVLLSIGVSLIVLGDARVYAVLDYRLHDGRLPGGPVAVLLAGSISELMFLLLPLAILLFPDGRLPRRWRWLLRVYVVLAVLYEVVRFAGEGASIFGHRIEVDIKGQFVTPEHLTGIAGFLSNLEGAGGGLLFPLFLGFWLAFVGRQVGSFRRSGSERRQQLKWLTSGAAVSVAGIVILFVASQPNGTPSSARQAVEVAAVLMVAALPASFGVGILKYRLYDIDRLLSRTLSYLIITGLLVSVFIGLVVLTTRLLPFSSPVGVAASTLAAAALFNPLRLRIQRLVERRFNRAHYDVETTVAAFRLRLREAVDMDIVQRELLRTVDRAVEPAHASLWIAPPGPGLRR